MKAAMILALFAVVALPTTVLATLTPYVPPPAAFPTYTSGGATKTCTALWEVMPENGDTCDSIATMSGLGTTAALTALNPGLNCTGLTAGQLVCSGAANTTLISVSTVVNALLPTCGTTTCGALLSPVMTAFLNANDFKAFICAIAKECAATTSLSLSGIPLTQGESLTVTLAGPTRATNNATAAGLAPIGAFFGSTLPTYPGSTLSIILSPNYYGLGSGLTEFVSNTVTGSRRKLLGTVTTRQSQNPQAKLSP